MPPCNFNNPLVQCFTDEVSDNDCDCPLSCEESAYSFQISSSALFSTECNLTEENYYNSTNSYYSRVEC